MVLFGSLWALFQECKTFSLFHKTQLVHNAGCVLPPGWVSDCPLSGKAGGFLISCSLTNKGINSNMVQTKARKSPGSGGGEHGVLWNQDQGVEALALKWVKNKYVWKMTCKKPETEKRRTHTERVARVSSAVGDASWWASGGHRWAG